MKKIHVTDLKYDYITVEVDAEARVHGSVYFKKLAAAFPCHVACHCFLLFSSNMRDQNVGTVAQEP